MTTELWEQGSFGKECKCIPPKYKQETSFNKIIVEGELMWENWFCVRTQKSIFTIYGHSSHLGHVNFIKLYLQAYIQNKVENGPVVSEKSKLNFHI